jgi:gem associated protein 5
MAVGDTTIKIFHEKQNEKYFKNYANNIKTEITQIAWHPTKETIIAFGTKDGKVGIIDIGSSNRYL